MKDIKCPSCGKTFRIDPSSFEEILLQIKDEEFNKQIKERLILAEEDNKKALEILKRELKIQLIEQNRIKESEIQTLESKLKIAEEKKTNALNDLKNQATNKINSLNKFNLVLASFFFSLMTLCVKNIDKRIPIYELVLFRSLLSLIITLFIINLKNINPWGNNRPLLILRGVLGTLALVCIFYAIRNMPLSISTVIQYTYPIFISIFAGIFINEKITKNIIIALIIGWIGILVILNPIQLSNINVEIENISILIAFFGAICTALAYVTVKKLSFTENVYVIIEYFPLVSFITLLPIVLINWVTPNWNELVWIIGIGLFTQLGQTFLTIGLKNLPASEASTINYLQVLFGSIWGVLFFNEIININFLLGASLVLLGTIISTTKIMKST